MKNFLKLLIGTIVIAGSQSCSDIKFGDDFLGEKPESSGAQLDSMFVSMANSDKVLTKAYTYLPYGIPTGGGTGYNKLGGNVLEAISDLHHSFRNNISDGPVNLYYNGALSPNVSSSSQGTEAFRFGQQLEYHAIRYAWIYIENIHKVPDMSADQRNMRVAEAKMLIALSYAEMLRYMGGVPLLDHAIDVNEEMNFPRNTFAETVDFIVQLLDEAAPYLPWKQNDVDEGRMTKAGALALKHRILLFAASPTFNSSAQWHPMADVYTCYTNFDGSRWDKAIKAGEAFFAELRRQGGYALTMPEEETHQARRLAYRSGYYDRGGSEVIISTRRGYSASTHSELYDQRYYSGPTLNYVNMFSWEDGTDFPENFDWKNPSKDPFFTEQGVPTRDPRLYENITVPGDLYFNGTVAPLHINHPEFRLGSGFRQMKFILQSSSDRDGRPVQWPYLRLPEVLLSQAEAINEFHNGPTEEAYGYIDEVRSRVGIPPLARGLSKEMFREAIIRERALEFGFEEVRWFDLIRLGREADFRKKLYGLTSKGNDQNAPTKFTFSTYELSDRFWVNTWNTKWYLAPVSQVEIDKDYGMIQNPGW